MKNKIQFIILLIFTLVGSVLFAQEDPNKEIVSLKSVVIVDDKPIVYQNQVRGGLHQVEGSTADIPGNRVQKSMIATVASSGRSFRYLGETGTNSANLWEEVYIVTFFDNLKKYNEGAIVVAQHPNGMVQLFRAKTEVAEAVSGNENRSPFFDSSSWSPLGETTSFFNQADNQNLQVVSGGKTIVFANSDYVLPSAATVPGQTYLIKNKRTQILTDIQEQETSTDINTGLDKVYTVSTSTAFQIEISTVTGETIDGVSFPRFLYKQNDFMTFLSDGENWHYINKGGSQASYLYPYKPARNVGAIDGTYYGKRNASGDYVTGSYRVVCYLEGSTAIYSIQRYTDGIGWQQTGAH